MASPSGRFCSEYSISSRLYQGILSAGEVCVLYFELRAYAPVMPTTFILLDRTYVRTQHSTIEHLLAVFLSNFSGEFETQHTHP